MAPQTAYPSSKLPMLPEAASIDDVLANFDVIIAWAIDNEHGLGYFATVYKRATKSIKAQVEAGGYFDDDERMTRFDIIFAQRYFDALNSYFHPRDYEAPTHTWQWCFDGHEYEGERPIILQHMLTAVNSHVNLDLGIAAAQAVGSYPIDDLAGDFGRVNDLLADEVTIFLNTLASFSSGWRFIRRILLCEDVVLNQVLRIFRNLAWSFAKQVHANPGKFRGNVGVQDSWACVLGSYYLHTNDAVDVLVRYIRDGESTDVARNIKVLDGQLPLPV